MEGGGGFNEVQEILQEIIEVTEDLEIEARIEHRLVNHINILIGEELETIFQEGHLKGEEDKSSEMVKGYIASPDNEKARRMLKELREEAEEYEESREELIELVEETKNELQSAKNIASQTSEDYDELSGMLVYFLNNIGRMGLGQNEKQIRQEIEEVQDELNGVGGELNQISGEFNNVEGRMNKALTDLKKL